MKAIFTLENGFDITNGRAGQDGRQFGRQAYVGLTSNSFGTVTLGRQYDSVVDYLGPLTANGSWGGTFFSHPYDNDNTDNSFRINNSIKYQSANYGGFSFGGLYGFSNNSEAFATNRAYSAGMQYANGPLKVAAAYLQTQGANGNAGGAITEANAANLGSGNGNIGAAGTISTKRQRTYGVGANYSVGALTFGGVWTQSRFDDVLASDADASFNNYELNARYNLTPALALGGAYTYTSANAARLWSVRESQRTTRLACRPTTCCRSARTSTRKACIRSRRTRADREHLWREFVGEWQSGRRVDGYPSPLLKRLDL